MSGTEAANSPTPLFERRTIDFVPHKERHGKPFGQFTLWFGANIQITAVVTGALAVIFGANAFWGIIGLFLGNIIGGSVMALHAAQGPRLGLPQMISSRAQFGVYGAALPLVLVVLMYLGFAATGAVLAGQAVDLIIPTGNPAFGIIIFGALTALVAVLGYKYIHVLGQISTVVGAVGFTYIGVRLLLQEDLGAVLGTDGFTIPMFLLAISLSAGWQMTYGPYVADYSRYLPADTPEKRTFLSCFSGSVAGAQWSMTLGALFASITMPAGQSFIENQVGFVGNLAGGGALALLMYIVIVVGKLTVNTLNAYGGYMTILTSVSSFTKRVSYSPWIRFAYVVGFLTISVVIALVATEDFLANFKNFVLMLLMVFIPWSAINLVDYYLISKEKVDIPALYDPKGRYGAWNVPALLTYVVGVVVQIPFLAQSMYTGPITPLLGGADISWIVGLIVTALVYYPVAKKFQNPPAQMIYPVDQQETQGAAATAASNN